MKDLSDRFWSKVNILGPDECWEWQAYQNEDGYGIFRLNGVNEKAHRVAWMLTFDDDPHDQQVLHHCDNPSCCNPDHLWLGTQLENIDDMLGKKRNAPLPSTKGEQNARAKLTEVQVADIRRRLKAGEKNITLAREYGVRDSIISKIKHGTRWKS